MLTPDEKENRNILSALGPKKLVFSPASTPLVSDGGCIFPLNPMDWLPKAFGTYDFNPSKHTFTPSELPEIRSEKTFLKIVKDLQESAEKVLVSRVSWLTLSSTNSDPSKVSNFRLIFYEGKQSCCGFFHDEQLFLADRKYVDLITPNHSVEFMLIQNRSIFRILSNSNAEVIGAFAGIRDVISASAFAKLHTRPPTSGNRRAILI